MAASTWPLTAGIPMLVILMHVLCIGLECVHDHRGFS